VCVCLLLQDLLQSCSRGGEEESRSFGRGRREGTGAKVVQSAEVCNNCARSFANLILHVDGCQTKLSHFDAVACNTEQCPDLSHARSRGLGINLIPQPMNLGIDLIPQPMGLGIDLIPQPSGLGSIP